MLAARVFRILLSLVLCLSGTVARAQDPAAQEKSTPTFTSEARLVLVDAVVTDKRGEYIRDLTQNDFHVYEDGKEQPLKSFSSETDPSVANRQHYIVLFFDNTRMTAMDEVRARFAAAKFIAANAGPTRLMAIVNYGGGLKLSHNFTSDAERLIKVVRTNILPPAGPDVISSGVPDLSAAELDYSVQTVLLGLRTLAKRLATIPGRKTLIFLSVGFPVPGDRWSDVTSAIDACNKSNVAVYPIDVRGLVAPGSAETSQIPAPAPVWNDGVFRYGEEARFGPAAFAPQRPTGPPPSTSPRPGMLGTYVPDRDRTPMNRRGPEPPPLASMNANIASDPQAVLYTLAAGTGGFVILNNNDLVSGLEKIGKEQAAYYILGFSPGVSPEGRCHNIKVKVDRGGTLVRSRSGYCTIKPVDLLAGSDVEKVLESRAAGGQSGDAPMAIMSLPFFYVAPNVARVNLVMDLPASAIKFEKEKGKFRAAVNILGIAYKPDGNIAARFSDTAKIDLDSKKEVDEFQKAPYHYEKQFETASGKYRLTVVFTSGESFGRLEAPLHIEPFDGKQFAASSVALSNRVVDLAQKPGILDQALLENRTLLTFEGMQVVPSAANRFKRTDTTSLYVELYEPLLLGADRPRVTVQYTVFDRRSGAPLMDTGMFAPESPITPGNPVIRVGLRLRADLLPPGAYRLTFQARDSAGRTVPARSADFDVE